MTDTLPSEWRISLAGEEATAAFGARLAYILRPGLQIHLIGTLGSGKTTLVRGLLRAAGYTGRVKSPTYPLVEIYNLSRLYFYHFDFYRVTNPNEIDDRGLRDYFGGDAVCVVEWAAHADGRLPVPDLSVRFEFDGDSGRTVTLTAVTGVGEACMSQLTQTAVSQD